MAEIFNKNSNEKRKIHSNVRVDHTPMVDLGFLLISFFVFTAAMSEAKVMETKMPNDTDSTNDQVCESCALTVIAGSNNKLYYYEGLEERAKFKETTYAASGLRQLIVNKKKAVLDKLHNDRMILIIKTAKGSNFKNLVDIMDETTICAVKRYYMAELNDFEMKLAEASDHQK